MRETYGLKERIGMTIGDATKKIPFDDDYFDGVFTDGSMHEWSDPLTVFNEIERVLKPNASFYVGDLKRNTNPLVAFMMGMKANKVMKAGLQIVDRRRLHEKRGDLAPEEQQSQGLHRAREPLRPVHTREEDQVRGDGLAGEKAHRSSFSIRRSSTRGSSFADLRPPAFVRSLAPDELGLDCEPMPFHFLMWQPANKNALL